MQSKAICNDENIRKNFFLLMIVPLLIGLMISLTNSARAEWTKEDPLLKNAPRDQGWKPIKIYQKPSIQKKSGNNS